MLASSLLLTACGEPTAPPKAPLSQYTQQGETYLEQFQFKVAITAAQNAIVAYPEQIDGYLMLAKIYLRLGQAEASSFILSEYKNSKNSEYYFLLLESYQKEHKLISAQQLIDENSEALQKQPYRLMKEQAKIRLREHKLEQALTLFKTLEKQPQYQADAFIGQAQISALKNDLPSAISLLNLAIDSDAKNSEALILKSYLQINSNQLQKAEKTLSLALTVLPSSDIFTPERISILQALTEVLTSQGRSSEALLYSRILADEFPEAISLNQDYAQATEQYHNKEFGLAKQTLDKILKIAPGHKKALTLYGVILYSQGDMKGAQEYLNGIIDVEKNSAKLTQLYAMTQLKLDNSGAVLTLLEDIIATEESYETLTLYLLAALDQQQFNKAKLTLSRIEKLFPNSDKSALLSANYYSKINPADHEKAQAILQSALNSAPTNIHLQTAYLKKLIFLKKDKATEQYIQQLQAAESSSLETQLLVAKYKLYSKQYQQAGELFSAVLAQQENNLTGLYGLAQSKQQAQDWQAAQNAYRNVILFHPKELRGYQGFVLNQIKQSLDIEQAYSRLPENYDPAILALVLADAQLQQRNIQQAAVHIEQASQKLENNLHPYFTDLQKRIDYQRAIIALTDKEFNKARKITLTALKSTPEHASLLILLTKIEIESKQLNEAKKVIQQVEAILPNNPILSIYKAEIALAENNSPKALKILQAEWQATHNEQAAQKLYTLLQQIDPPQATLFLEQWQQQAPKSLLLDLNNALLLQKKGDEKGALALYEKVLIQNPNNLTSLNNIAWLYFINNDSRATDLAERAFKLAPKNAAVVDTYGWILYKSGDIEQAKPLLLKAHQLAPSNAEIEQHWLAVKDR